MQELHPVNKDMAANKILLFGHKPGGVGVGVVAGGGGGGTGDSAIV